jgi:hypothetical protein
VNTVTTDWAAVRFLSSLFHRVGRHIILHPLYYVSINLNRIGDNSAECFYKGKVIPCT